MTKAAICPVCEGKGVMTELGGSIGGTSGISEVTCHGCYGKGWIEVED